MKPKGYIFDLDGTLTDSLEELADACNFALQKRAYPTHTTEKYKQFVGRGIRNLVKSAMPAEMRENDKEVDTCLAIFAEQYATHCCDKTKAYDGIENLLRILQNNKQKTAILSNKQNDLANIVVSHIFPEKTFVSVVGESERTPKKPDPTGALRICRTFGLAPSEVLFVGDSRWDIETARNAGMKVAAVTWGFATKDELLPHRPDFLIDTPADIAGVEL